MIITCADIDNNNDLLKCHDFPPKENRRKTKKVQNALEFLSELHHEMRREKSGSYEVQ